MSRYLLENENNFRTQVYLIQTGANGDKVEISFNSTELPWPEMIEKYLAFLSALGYVISEDDRDRILGE